MSSFLACSKALAKVFDLATQLFESLDYFPEATLLGKRLFSLDEEDASRFLHALFDFSKRGEALPV